MTSLSDMAEFKTSTKFMNFANGSEYYKIYFELIEAEDLNFEEWQEINHKIQDLYYEIKERNKD